MAPSYRIVKIEPAYRITTEARPDDGAGGPNDPARIVKIEQSYRIIQAEQSAAPDTGQAGAAAPEPVAPACLAAAAGAFDGHLLKDLIDRTPDAVLLMSGDGTILFANATCVELLGYAPEDLVGQAVERLVPPEVRAAHPSHRQAWQPEGSRRPMARITKLSAVAKDGRLIPVDVAVTGVSADPVVFLVSIREASEHQALLHGLEQLATTDPLTGLLNRRSFQAACLREFERFRRHATPLSVMLLDIDHFKSINDRFGHDAGDKALVQLAATCLSKLRRTDVMARLGGEEFVILVPGTKPEDTLMLAERLRAGVGEINLMVGTTAINFTVSIGLSEARAEDPSLDATLGRADSALYKAKSEGRNRVVVMP